MDTRWDLAITNSDKQLMLVVEVKTKLGASAEWASKLRRNILAHGIFPNAPFFLMAFPDRLYLWKNADFNFNEISPTYTIEAHSIFQPYFEQSGITADMISDHSFEIIVASWLSELTHKSRHSLGTSQLWLLDSGLYDAVAGGSLNYEVAT